MADTLEEHLSDIMVYLVIQAWRLAWAVSMGHLTRKLAEAFEISRWQLFLKMAVTFVEHLTDIIVYLVIQAWHLAWAVSMGHLTRTLTEAFEISISRWLPFFKITNTLVKHLSDIMLFGAKRMNISMNCLFGSLWAFSGWHLPYGSLNDTFSHRNVLGFLKRLCQERLFNCVLSDS